MVVSLMPVSSILDNPLVKELLGDLAEKGVAEVRKRMVAVRPWVVRSMREGRVTVTRYGERFVIRDAMFRLWHKALGDLPGAGEIADLIRDFYDDQVVSDVRQDIDAGTPLHEVVKLTLNATVERLK
jgi:hypothetical protein